MTFYDERESRDLRGAFEDIVMYWPGVHTRKMFGHPGYTVHGRLFSFLVTRGVVILKLGRADRETLVRERKATPFVGGHHNVVEGWTLVPVGDVAEVRTLVPYLEKAYQRALAEDTAASQR